MTTEQRQALAFDAELVQRALEVLGAGGPISEALERLKLAALTSTTEATAGTATPNTILLWDAAQRVLHEVEVHRAMGGALTDLAKDMQLLALAAQGTQKYEGPVEQPLRESKMVVIERNEQGVPIVWCDPEIAPIVAALNAAGIRTSWSCSGHGYRPGVIGLADDRHLVIAKDDAEFKLIQAIFPLDINGQPVSPVQADGVARKRLAKERIDFILADSFLAANGSVYSTRIYDFVAAIEDEISQQSLALPHPGLPEASALLDSLLAEYHYPSNPKNAARAGWEAARRWLAVASQQAAASAPTTPPGERP